MAENYPCPYLKMNKSAQRAFTERCTPYFELNAREGLLTVGGGDVEDKEEGEGGQELLRLGKFRLAKICSLAAQTQKEGRCSRT